jgi:hypothetical protein
VKQAKFEELAPYVGPKTATQIIEYFLKQHAAIDPESPAGQTTL